MTTTWLRSWVRCGNSFDSRGRVRIETKDEMRSRGTPSPDRADALMLAWASALMVPDQVFTFDAVSDAEEAAVAADLAEWEATCAGYQTQVDEAAALLGVESPRVLSWANEFKRAAAEADDELARLRLALRIERMPADVNVALRTVGALAGMDAMREAGHSWAAEQAA